jgi:hypothetical protein
MGNALKTVIARNRVVRRVVKGYHETAAIVERREATAFLIQAR